MQHLQWFPGHMTAAMRMMEENLKAVDGVIIVLDARAVKASVNEKLARLFVNKKVLYVINKCDLVEKKDVLRNLKYLEEHGKAAVDVSATLNRDVAMLYNRIFALLKEKLDKNKEKGVFKPIRIMVAGIPNTGKSTIINALIGAKKTATGNKAGVTKGKQWVRINDLELLDTPGTMPPAFDNQTYARHLAYIGAMNDGNIDFNDLAYELLGELAAKFPEALKTKYGITELSDDKLEIMNAVCVRRGFLLKGGEYDYERCAKAVVEDFRKGRIGKIALE